MEVRQDGGAGGAAVGRAEGHGGDTQDGERGAAARERAGVGLRHRAGGHGGRRSTPSTAATAPTASPPSSGASTSTPEN